MQGMFDTIINFTPSKFNVKLWSYFSSLITNTIVYRGFRNWNTRKVIEFYFIQ